MHTHSTTDTTDVQTVTANIEDGYTMTVQCSFLTGSNARGCMVVLTSLYGEESQNLTRNITTNLAMSTITLNYVQSCYHGVEAFDVESDGTVGSLAVPGMLFRNVGTGHNPSEPCMTDPKRMFYLSIIIITNNNICVLTNQTKYSFFTMAKDCFNCTAHCNAHHHHCSNNNDVCFHQDVFH